MEVLNWTKREARILSLSVAVRVRVEIKNGFIRHSIAVKKFGAS